MAVTSRRFRRSCALALLALALGACGNDDTEPVAGDDVTSSTTTVPESSSPDTTETERTEPDAELEFRPVLQQLPPGGTGNGCATPEGEWVVDQPVLAPQLEDGQEVACFELGPAGADGSVVESATAQEDGLEQWGVALMLTSDGIASFNETAGACFEGAPACPTRLLAIVVDRAVVSAPSINAPEFERDQISLSGGFTQAEAEALAAGLG